MIDLNWKLFVLLFGIIDPTLPGRPGVTPLSRCFSSIILKRLAQAIKLTPSDFEDTLIRHI